MLERSAGQLETPLKENLHRRDIQDIRVRRPGGDRLLDRAAKISDAALRESFLRDVPEHAHTLATALG